MACPARRLQLSETRHCTFPNSFFFLRRFNDSLFARTCFGWHVCLCRISCLSHLPSRLISRPLSIITIVLLVWCNSQGILADEGLSCWPLLMSVTPPSSRPSCLSQWLCKLYMRILHGFRVGFVDYSFELATTVAYVWCGCVAYVLYAATYQTRYPMCTGNLMIGTHLMPLLHGHFRMIHLDSLITS